MRNNDKLGASADAETGSRPAGCAPSGRIATRFDPARGPKIRLIINDAHIALVLRVKRELCVGEEVRRAA